MAVSCAAWADEALWRGKPISKWSQEDAKEVLADSPWVKKVQLQYVRDLSPDERRQSGDMQADMGKGVGPEGTGLFGPVVAQLAIERAHYKPDPGKVVVRWEARPVHASEVKLGNAEAKTPDGDYYRIVVYDVPTPKKWNLEKDLRDIAFLRRYQKKDLKPARVVIMRKDEGLADIAYFFPRSVEITKKDSYVGFRAQVGRLVLWQVFLPAEMQVQDQLEL
jgi:hypothetical protein